MNRDEIGVWLETSQVSSETSTPLEGRERPKKEANYSRVVDGKFHNQGNLHRRLVLGGHKMAMPGRILKVYVEALNWAQSPLLFRWSQRHLTFAMLRPGNSS